MIPFKQYVEEAVVLDYVYNKYQKTAVPYYRVRTRQSLMSLYKQYDRYLKGIVTPTDIYLWDGISGPLHKDFSDQTGLNGIAVYLDGELASEHDAEIMIALSPADKNGKQALERLRSNALVHKVIPDFANKVVQYV